jgi:hypothetical protein
MTTMMFAEASIVAVVPSQVSCDIAGEVVILNLADGVYYGLNEVGAHVWELLAQPRSVQEIEQRLLDEYDVDSETCRSQVRTLLTNLYEIGLIEVRS